LAPFLIADKGLKATLFSTIFDLPYSISARFWVFFFDFRSPIFISGFPVGIGRAARLEQQLRS
jgi:hypothetical protein